LERGSWRIHLSKDSHKFSCTHLTIFPDGSKERLHGHNYQVKLTFDLVDASFEKMLPFSQLKTLIRNVCDQLDERILIAGENPFVRIQESEKETEVVICGNRYVFPTSEVVVLQIKNVTAELLAREVAERIMNRLDLPREVISGIEVYIEETRGQAASYSLRWGDA
jgi:6-pyruvoyltetrahydropterin/6-carboxytetrahydropterin synthase